VRDEDDGPAAIPQATQHLPQLDDFRRRQHGRRLVENQHLRAAVQRSQNFDALRFADRQIRDEPRRIDAQARSLRQLTHLTLGRTQVEREPAPELPTKNQVFRDGERRHEHEVLVHHRDARLDGLPGAPVRDIAKGSTFNRDLDDARIGRIHPREHSHQGGLAGAILAHERVNLA